MKTARRVARLVGSILDAEDRKLLGQGIVISGGVVWIAGTLGLAVRMFLFALGG